MKRNAFDILMKTAKQQVKKNVLPNVMHSNKLVVIPTNSHYKTKHHKIENPLENNNKKSDDTYEFLLRFDGGSRGNPGISGCGSVIYYRGSEIWNKSVYLGDDHTNNYAEYYGLIYGLIGAKKLNIKKLKVEGDSKIIINQITGAFKINSKYLMPLYNKAINQLSHFDDVDFKHIYRDKNKRADELANLAMDKKDNL